MADILFVLMPYADIVRPSLALGLLKATLDERKLDSRILYANLDFEQAVGPEFSSVIKRAPVSCLLEEWTFAGAAFPDFEPDHAAYVDALMRQTCDLLQNTGKPIHSVRQQFEQLLWSVRCTATAFVKRVAREVVAGKPRIVACSSTFQQHCASLALLREIRLLDETVVSMMGGANCEGPMGAATHRSFPWVDYVVSGEAELLIGDLCEKVLDRGRNIQICDLPHRVLGPAHRLGPVATPSLITVNPTSSVPPTRSLDALPIPDFEDYFEALKRRTDFSPFIRPAIPIETSRGCWWGERRHCTFCGLNGNTMTYRTKSAARVMSEIKYLADRYGVTSFSAVDNILNMRFFDDVLPQFESLGAPYVFFFETKANLKREQVDLLARSGVRSIQPGIESMHNSVLRMLAKGTSVLMNVQLLKWCAEMGIEVHWNFLYGAPREEDEWYEEMCGLLPLIRHLEAPLSLSRIRIDRFSPYHSRPDDFGLKLVPADAYQYVYPLKPTDLGDLAYFFEDERQVNNYAGGLRSTSARIGLGRLLDIIREWQCPSAEPRPKLSLSDTGSALVIHDSRPCATNAHHTLTGLSAAIFRVCDNALSLDAILRVLHETKCTRHEVTSILTSLCDHKLMLTSDGCFLSLAVPERPLTPPIHRPCGEFDLVGYIRHRRSLRAANALRSPLWSRLQEAAESS